MPTSGREVSLDIYVDGVYHGTKSFQVSGEEEEQVECRVTYPIYDLFRSSAVIDSLEEVHTPEDMPVTSSVVDGQLEDEDKNVSSVLVSPTEVAGSSSGIDASPETPENSPTESTTVWMVKKMCGVFQRLCGVLEPLCVPDTHQPTSETDLVDIAQSGVPVPLVSEQETPVDLVDLEESSVSALNHSEPEPVSSEGQEVDIRDAIADLVCEDLRDSAGPSGRTSGMDASPETPVEISPKESTKVRKRGKMEAVFQKLFRIDPAVPETLCLPDASVPEMDPESDLSDSSEFLILGPYVPEMDPESDLSDSTESWVVGPSVAEMDPESDLSDSTESWVVGPSVAEMDPESDLSDSTESWVVGPSVAEMDPESDLSDSNESWVVGPSVAEMDPESDLSDSTESWVVGPSVAEMDPESDLSDSTESWVVGPSVAEMDPESDLFDSDELCVAGPSSPYACTSEQELVQEETGSRLAERVKGCTKDLEPVTEVWNNIFIGNQEIAEDRMTLKELGITHILNAAALKKNLRVSMGVPLEEEDLLETIDAGASYYRGMNITHCRMPTTQSNISKYFVPAARFIHKARENPQNKVLIHCATGVCHAPTLFLAYLMIHHDMTGEEAIDHLIQVRYIKPDLEFLEELVILNEVLCTMRLVHKTTKDGRENDNTWLKKLEAEIRQKKFG